MEFVSECRKSSWIIFLPEMGLRPSFPTFIWLFASNSSKRHICFEDTLLEGKAASYSAIYILRKLVSIAIRRKSFKQDIGV